MALEYNIWINRLTVQYSLSGKADVVTSIMASMSGYDTSSVGQFRGTRGHVFLLDEEYPIGPPVLSSYTAFQDLTEAECVDFVKSSWLYQSRFSELSSRVQEIQPSSTQGLCALPWD